MAKGKGNKRKEVTPVTTEEWPDDIDSVVLCLYFCLLLTFSSYISLADDSYSESSELSSSEEEAISAGEEVVSESSAGEEEDYDPELNYDSEDSENEVRRFIA